MTQNTFNFDEDIDRRAVPALKVHPNVLGQTVQIYSLAALPIWISNHRRLFYLQCEIESRMESLDMRPSLTGCSPH
jgi:hypothetical protein